MIVFPVSCTVRIQIEVWVGAPKGNTLTFIVYPYYSPFFPSLYPIAYTLLVLVLPSLTIPSTAQHSRAPA